MPRKPETLKTNPSDIKQMAQYRSLISAESLMHGQIKQYCRSIQKYFERNSTQATQHLTRFHIGNNMF